MLREAADRMGAFHVRSLAVVENKEIVGRITDRDVTQAVSAGMDPGTTPVKYAMAPSVVPGEEEMDEAVEIMEDA
jgi:CBS domain-containing protein